MTETKAQDCWGSSIRQLLEDRVERSPHTTARWAVDDSGRWQSTTWSALARTVSDYAAGLRGLGLQPRDRVAIVAASGARWEEIHLACVSAGGVVVGVDPHASPACMAEQIEVARPSVLVAEGPVALKVLSPQARACLRFAVLLDQTGCRDFHGVPTIGIDGLNGRRGPRRSVTVHAGPEPDDPAWLIFTSGTTGRPKGLVYTHRQVCSAVGAILDAFSDIDEGARLISWLPLSNPFQRIINLCAVARGAQTYFVADPRQVMEHLPAVRPNVFIGVPRFFEKLHNALAERIATGGALRRAIGRWAITVGSRHAAEKRAGRIPRPFLRMSFRLADQLVFRRIREAFGGELRYFVSGSAAMPTWLLEKLHAMGLLVLEAYGLSECIVPVSANTPAAYRFGSVGRPMGGNEVRLAPDGELLLRSAGTFAGYLGEADATGVVNGDGWLATGDLAEIDTDGFIHLVGRKSEVFKTSTGRRVAPSAIEGILRSAPGVEHAAVFGAGRKSLLAVLSVAPGSLDSLDRLRGHLETALLELPEPLRPAGAVLTPTPFGIDTGELTGNLKLRRQAVHERFAVALEELAAAVDRRAKGAEAGVIEPGPEAHQLLIL